MLKNRHHAQNDRSRDSECNGLFETVIIIASTMNKPDWIFWHNGPVEADIMPRLVAEFPGFRSRWEKHVESWNGKPAGNYNDITQFVYFVVEDLYPSGKTEEVQRLFDMMEDWLKNGSNGVQELVVVGFFEDLQNLASQQTFGKEAFVPFLGPESREEWDELERFWAGKSNIPRNSSPRGSSDT